MGYALSAEPQPRIVEVGPRDGLQNESAVVSAEKKAAFVDALAKTGLKEIETGAFVSPQAVPQMADTAEVFAKIQRRPGVVYSALVPNQKGLERAMQAGADKISVFTAASETFNQKNIRASISESIERFRPVIRETKAARLPLRAYISTAFHCPYEGPVKPVAVLPIVKTLMGLGVDELSIGDTIGKASPRDVRSLLKPLLDIVPVEKLFLHFHDTYGMAIANALTAWREFGVTGFDSSTGGLGGCPYAPGASGNIATEDLVFALSAEGADMGIDIEKLTAAARALVPSLGHPLDSRLSRVASTGRHS
ncbi:MAG: hydroxymethylglutaryl-CoA lyase [Elusimicrobia bacterium]|nr:MAG: hydroxymethylglutaryl-CoA lyase [Elusimicrobiota bacterium]